MYSNEWGIRHWKDGTVAYGLPTTHTILETQNRVTSAPYIRTKLLTFYPVPWRKKRKTFVGVYVLLAREAGLRNMFNKNIKAAKLFHLIRVCYREVEKRAYGGIQIRILSIT